MTSFLLFSTYILMYIMGLWGGWQYRKLWDDRKDLWKNIRKAWTESL